jgi:RHS repeat-associated protein
VTFYQANWQKTQIGNETPGTLSAYSNAILFGGYYRDAETGLYNVRNRYYHVQLGWITRDPLGYVDGMSLYEYVNGLPTGRADPWGQEANKNEADRYEGFWGKIRYVLEVVWTALKGGCAPLDPQAAGDAGFGIIDIHNSELRIKLEKELTSKGKDPRGHLEWCLRVFATKGAQALGATERKTLRDAGYVYDPQTNKLKRISDQNPPGEKGPRGPEGETGATTTKKKPDKDVAGGEVTPGDFAPPAAWEEEGARGGKWKWWSSDGKQPDPVSVIVQGMKGMGEGVPFVVEGWWWLRVHVNRPFGSMQPGLGRPGTTSGSRVVYIP